MIASLCFTAVSTLFNLYAMRRGALVVGRGSDTVASDLSAYSGLICGFLAAGPVTLWRLLQTAGWLQARTGGRNATERLARRQYS